MSNHRPPARPPGPGDPSVGPPVVQILATEHWSLLATRSMTWSEIFSRTGTFLTVLSANTVALTLIANASGFGDAFTALALMLLPVVLLVGLATYVRLVEADIEDAWLVIGMNRIRHAYLELAPQLEPYFVAGHHDDAPGLLQTYSFRRRIGVTHWLSGSPVIVGVIDAVVAGVVVGVVGESIDVGHGLRNVSSVLGGLLVAGGLAIVAQRHVREARRGYRARFPASGAVDVGKLSGNS